MADTALFTMVINFSPSMSVGSVPGCNSSCFLKQICKTFLIHYLHKLLNKATLMKLLIKATFYVSFMLFLE
jgi:hypothetical protein